MPLIVRICVHAVEWFFLVLKWCTQD